MEILFCLGISSLRWLKSPRLVEFKADKGVRDQAYKGDQKHVCVRFLKK